MKIDTGSVLKKFILLFVVLVVLHFSKAFLMPLVVGGIIATLFIPFSNWLEKKRIPRGVAALFSLLSLLLFLAAGVLLIAKEIANVTSDFESIKQKGLERFAAAQQFIFDNLGIAFEKQSALLSGEQISITGMLQSVIGSVQYIFINLVLILAYTFFLLYYRNHLKTFVLQLVEQHLRRDLEKVMYKTARVAQQYLFGLSKMIGLLWLMYGIGFAAIGVDNFIFFAILCGFLEIIPFIGNITGTSLTFLVVFLNGGSTAQLIGVLAVYGTVQFIQGWFIEPLILGPQVKINPLFTIVALLLGEIIWGIPGVFVAIPVTAMLKIIFDHVESLQPYGFLMGKIEKEK